MLAAAALAITLAAPAPTGGAALSVSMVKKVDGLHPLAFAACPTGSRVAASMENNDIRIIDAATRQTLLTLKGHPQPPLAVAWSPDGELLATGDESARIFIWNPKSGAKIRTIIGHIKGIQHLSFNKTHLLLASTGEDDVVNVWNVKTGKKAAEIDGHGLNLYSACFSPIADELLIGTLAGGARLYKILGDGAHLIKELNFNNPSGEPHSVLDCCWSPDGTRILTGAKDDLAVLWDGKTGKKLGSFHGHTEWVMHVAFSPNGRYAATSSPDRTVRIWDTKTFQQVKSIDDESAIGAPLCFTSDGKFLLATAVDDSAEFFSVAPAQNEGKTAAHAAPQHSRRRHRG